MYICHDIHAKLERHDLILDPQNSNISRTEARVEFQDVRGHLRIYRVKFPDFRVEFPDFQVEKTKPGLFARLTFDTFESG